MVNCTLTSLSVYRYARHKYFCESFHNWRLSKANERHRELLGMSWGPGACKSADMDAGLGSSFHTDLGQMPLTAESLFLFPWLMCMLWQLSLYWGLQASHPQAPYPCELSPGLQEPPKQVPWGQEGAHKVARGDKINLLRISLIYPTPW